MNDWIEDGSVVIVGLAVAAGALLVAGLVLLVLWRRARAAARPGGGDRARAEQERLGLELELAEQGSRLRIVRELHELVVGSVSTIISQADGARYAASADPEVAARTAAAIADTARTTLADLRRIMDLVRAGEEAAGPPPSLSSVRELLTVMRDGGLVVDLVETGDRLDLKPGAELAIYRILQEALSNALRHGGEGTSVRVSLKWTEQGIEMLVDDDGTRTRARREGLDPDTEAQQRPYSQDDDLAALTRRPVGRGMTEMRERAELFGGVFNAYEVPGVGFSVAAIFPGLQRDNGIHGDLRSGARATDPGQE